MPFLATPPTMSARAGFEWPIILVSLMLSGTGLGLIFSATAPMGEAGRILVFKQMTWVSLGLVLVDYSLSPGRLCVGQGRGRVKKVARNRLYAISALRVRQARGGHDSGEVFPGSAGKR
jgi:hypothetical protein